jgi:HEAT repeat protein
MSRLPAAHDFDGWVAQLAHPQRRPDAKAHLVACGAEALPAVRRGMQHPKPIVRQMCAKLLDKLADEAAFADLVRALDDDDVGVLKRALHALACDQCKDNECRPGEDLFVPRALELLHHDNPDIRASAIDTLGKVAPRRADVAEALASAADHDPDKGLRGMARRRVQAVAGGRVL